MTIEKFTYTHYDDYSEEAFPYSRKIKVTGLEITKSEHVNGVILASVRITEKGKGSVWISAEEFYNGLDEREYGDGPVRIMVSSKIK